MSVCTYCKCDVVSISDKKKNKNKNVDYYTINANCLKLTFKIIWITVLETCNPNL